MNIRRHLTMSFALALLAMGIATHAGAQEMYKGSFDLPAAAYWGNTLLQPGQYTIQLAPFTITTSRIRLEGAGIQANMFTARVLSESRSERSYLTILNDKGTFYIRELSAGQIGKTFSFPSSKAAKERALSASAGSVLTVPVTADAGF